MFSVVRSTLIYPGRLYWWMLVAPDELVVFASRALCCETKQKMHVAPYDAKHDKAKKTTTTIKTKREDSQFEVSAC